MVDTTALYLASIEAKYAILDELVNKGHALYHLERYDEAISYYDKALKQTTGYSLLSSSSSAHM